MQSEEEIVRSRDRGRFLAIQLVVTSLLCWALGEGAVNACVCSCYFSFDCQSGFYCSYSGCITTTIDGKLRDGVCKQSGGRGGGGVGPFLPEDWLTAGAALDLWLKAYEVAGSGGIIVATTAGEGREPDAELVATAQALPLDPEQHEFVRQLAISIQVAYLGLSTHPDDLPHMAGFFSPPSVQSGSSCSTPYAVEDHGRVLSLDPTLLGVGRLIREASVGEIQTPGQGIFDQTISKIPLDFPNYQTFGRCEFPHPPEHGHGFPYADGVSCLASELRGAIASVTLGRDCNNNGVPDSIDVTAGTSEDIDINGEPDECQINSIACPISGVAEGGTVSAEVAGYFGTCIVTIPTSSGDDATTVASNLAAAIVGDACVAAQEITSSARDRQLKITGFSLTPNSLSLSSTDAGLRFPIPLTKIPTLSTWLLILLGFSLGAAALWRLRI